MDADAEVVAAELLRVAQEEGQAVERVADDQDATALRRAVRRQALVEGLRIRTARMDGSVAVVMRDAAIWTDDTATMRRKLQPPS